MKLISQIINMSECVVFFFFCTNREKDILQNDITIGLSYLHKIKIIIKYTLSWIKCCVAIHNSETYTNKKQNKNLKRKYHSSIE